MELEESKADCYIDDMMAVLQDSKELVHRQDAQQAIGKLQDLKQKDHAITIECSEEILKQIKDEMTKMWEFTENAAAEEEYEELKNKFIELEGQLAKEREGQLEAGKEQKRKFTEPEAVITEKIQEIRLEQQKHLEYDKKKSEWQKELIASYCKNLLKVPAMPLLPRGQQCNFSEIYIRPSITREIKEEKGETKEIEVKSMSEIFIKNGVPLKHIYLLGDAGSGKSSFCKYMVDCWCIAHSDAQKVQDEFEGVKEMKKFDLMFYISLRHYQDIDSVQDMIKNRYDIDISSPFLEKDSAEIIILLDGLDEWSYERKSYNHFQTMGLPKQDVNKDYTIITTSRPWKVHTLGISETEIEQLLNLKGFDLRCERELIDRTVSQLNSSRHASKDASVLEQKLKEKSLKSLKQLPIMQQQLICLSFDGKLDKTSRCAIYTGMLELFFTWNDMRTTETSTQLLKCAQKVDLPKYLADKNILKLNSHLICDVSQLAYETLFNCPKDNSLTFDICMFDELDISDKVRDKCLKLGIITEDERPGLSVAEPPRSLFSFIHKSMQEFLAAVNICIRFNAKIGLSDNTGNVELAKKFNNEVFQKCSTVNDILEQSNVVIMLCGLEPRLATHVSKYIYDMVSEDSRVQEYRRKMNSDIYMYHHCITDIQKLMFDSMEELNATCSVESRPVFYIGDLVINIMNQCCDSVCTSIDQKQIATDSVLSINVDDFHTKNVKFTKYLPMFHHLETITISYGYESQSLFSTQSDEQRINDINNCVSETFKGNTLTLKSLSLDGVSYTDKYYPLYKTVVSYLPSLINLVAISTTYIAMRHDDTTTFYNFLERTSHLEQIHLESVYCECRKQHDVNLSKHKQLQYLNVNNDVSVIDADTTNLEIFRFHELKDTNYEKMFDIIRKSYKLKELELYGDYGNKSQLYHTNITERLVKVLPLLHNLSKLQLHTCRLTDNIIQLPLVMKSLKNIKLFFVTMSLTTWQKFVNSLPGIPRTVVVSVKHCYMTGDGEEFYDDWIQRCRGGKINDAIQYLKDLDHLFHVKDHSSGHFSFINIQEKCSEWDRCITSGSESAAKILIEKEILPSQRELHNACRVFGVDSHILSEICTVISKHIRKKSKNVIDVRPSYRNDHVLSSSYVSIVFIVVVKKNPRYLVSKDNYECYIKHENDYSSEGEIVAVKEMESDTSDIQSSDAVLENIRKCVNKNADDLLQKHSNLNVILPSLMKSVGYTSGKHDIKIKPCIALYVSVKGYIPLNETPFEKEIDGFPTDVLEGEFEPFIGGPNQYHEHLKMGVAIHANVLIGDTILGGTLGGFINHSVHGLCGITSAHVVYDSAELARVKNAQELSVVKTVYQPVNECMSAFGEVVLAVYNEGSESESGMEVALISIKNRQPKDGSFPEASNYKEAGFDSSNQLCFNSGEVCEISNLKRRTEVYKFGMSSGITRGSFALYGGIVRKDMLGQGNGFGINLKNQMKIVQIGENPFAEYGDSGALVMIEGTHDSAAIGIVEGGMKGCAFVTPICDILRAVGCTDGKMCQFTSGCNAVLTDSGVEMDVS
ncbi:uncharacterized protein LOC132731021 [Ruditapes philippinarum]|uniref:uncharacterized protein LOC132731021 n=1 Tax=Ruditapes philippinarum TaxID=129788 RepID=UPI00295B0E54|nr:uncharacterized protein LOC132731021 [Ruditapes philippinarum]